MPPDNPPDTDKLANAIEDMTKELQSFQSKATANSPTEKRDIIRTWLQILALVQTLFIALLFGFGFFTFQSMLKATEESNRILDTGRSIRLLVDSTQQRVRQVETLATKVDSSYVFLKGLVEQKNREAEHQLTELKTAIKRDTTEVFLRLAQVNKELDSLQGAMKDFEFIMVRKPGK